MYYQALIKIQQLASPTNLKFHFVIVNFPSIKLFLGKLLHIDVSLCITSALFINI